MRNDFSFIIKQKNILLSGKYIYRSGSRQYLERELHSQLYLVSVEIIYGGNYTNIKYPNIKIHRCTQKI